MAGIICFGFALILGLGSWYLFGTSHKLSPEKDTTSIQTNNQNSAVENSNVADKTVNDSVVPSPEPPPAPPEIKKAPAGEVMIGGGETTLGGAASKLPLRRVAVEPFAIGETEVTNGQYAEFIEETKHAAPIGWNNNRFPIGAADEPVTGVTWADANSYCEWLGKKLAVTIRLPNEAEWELAARGNTDYKYPWGKEWNDEAAASKETKGKVRSVKSFPKGRTPLGVYDMLGNVWEWTGDTFTDEFGNPVLFEKAQRKVIKGGSVGDSRDYLKITTREGRPERKPSDLIGFRYVIIRK